MRRRERNLTELTQQPSDVRPKLLRSPRRMILAALGILCVGLALVGVVVPGLPTTIFLILASYLFARSCPVLEEKLLRVRVFRPYLRYLDGNRAMPRRARVGALVMMWCAVTASLVLLVLRLHFRHKVVVRALQLGGLRQQPCSGHPAPPRAHQRAVEKTAQHAPHRLVFPRGHGLGVLALDALQPHL